jgi:hypothetical protein
MDKSMLHSTLSTTLKKYGIDNLALEMELVEAVFGVEKGTPRTAEQIKREIAEALRKSGAEGDIRQLIQSTIRSSLYLNPDGKDGMNFIEFAYLRSKHGEDINTFVNWWLANAGEPKYWSFARMKTMWPQAFAKKKTPRYATANSKWEQIFSPAPGKEE